MSDWKQRLNAAEADAERSEAAEHAAEARFRALRAQGGEAVAIGSEEFGSWMDKRRATDAAWGKWAILMDEKAAA